MPPKYVLAIDAGTSGVRCLVADLSGRLVSLCRNEWAYKTPSHNPRAIVAVACERELVEGVGGVRELFEGSEEIPAIAVIPLLRDGCVDTEVDEEQVLKAIALGSATEWRLLHVPSANRARL